MSAVDPRAIGRRGLIGATLMAGLLTLYLVLVVVRAIAFLGSGVPIGVPIGIALLVLPLLAAFLVVREFRFGFGSARLLRRLVAEGSPLPGAGLPASPSGRIERTAADDVFRAAADDVEARPDDWRAWFRAGLAYDLAGDRRRARRTIRRAIALERVTPDPPDQYT